MTSSDLIALPADAKERAAARIGTAIDGTGIDQTQSVRVGLACAEFNGGITDRLLTGALDALEGAGCDLADTIVAWVPGAFELPVVARELALSGAVDAVICLGAVIRGETGHYDFVAGECAAGLQRVQLDTGLPVVFGVLTTDTIDQALDRSEDGPTNKGCEAALTALQTAHLLRSIAKAAKGQPVGFSAADR
jgi:6,7-dimethyl-8-ribityllumazine synthase